jgi:tetratricopeptide (TPR) repeat protein
VTASLLADAREALAAAYFRTGDYDRVERLLGEALRRARSSGDRGAEAAALAQQGLLLHYRAIELPPEERAVVDPGPEQELFERALDVRRELGDAELLAESLFQLGLVHQVLRGDGATAAPYFREALDHITTVPDADPLLRSEIHRHVGFDLLIREDRHDAAIDHLQASLELRRQLDEPAWTVSGLVALAMAERVAGHLDEAAGHAREALELTRAEGLRGRFAAAAERWSSPARRTPTRKNDVDAERRGGGGCRLRARRSRGCHGRARGGRSLAVAARRRQVHDHRSEEGMDLRLRAAHGRRRRADEGAMDQRLGLELAAEDEGGRVGSLDVDHQDPGDDVHASDQRQRAAEAQDRRLPDSRQ